MKPKSALILGLGYTGRYLKSQLLNDFPSLELCCTNQSQKDGSIAWSSGRRFPQTTPAEFDCAFICFPPDFNFSEQFRDEIFPKAKKWILVSSTGFFRTTEKDELVTEKSPLDTSIGRARVENHLLETMGVILVHAAGIYGPGRDPRDWIERGRVGRSEKYINLIHVDDLSRFLISAMERSEPGQRWIACDEVKYRWSELIDTLGIKNVPNLSTKSLSKKVSSEFSRQILSIKLKYPDAAIGIQSLDFDRR